MPTCDVDPFKYDKPWHLSVERCRANGCKLKHVKLQDFKPGAKSQDRDKLRLAVRSGLIAGTNKVPQPTEDGRPTERGGWWWHEGDPELAIAKSKFGLW